MRCRDSLDVAAAAATLTRNAQRTAHRRGRPDDDDGNAEKNNSGRAREDNGFRIALAVLVLSQRSSGLRPRVTTIHLAFMSRNHDRGVLLSSAETCASLRRPDVDSVAAAPRRTLTTHVFAPALRSARRARRYRHHRPRIPSPAPEACARKFLSASRERVPVSLPI